MAPVVMHGDSRLPVDISNRQLCEAAQRAVHLRRVPELESSQHHGRSCHLLLHHERLVEVIAPKEAMSSKEEVALRLSGKTEAAPLETMQHHVPRQALASDRAD